MVYAGNGSAVNRIIGELKYSQTVCQVKFMESIRVVIRKKHFNNDDEA